VTYKTDPEQDYDADLDYSVADQLGIDVEDLEMCPKKVYDALLRYFHYYLSGGDIVYRGKRNHY
jgi:hypothetical protein